jgi:eukaryotic-like serine/threonine-protein kinase
MGKTFPRQTQGLVNAAEIADVQGKFEEAIPLLRQADNLQPDRGGETLAVPYFALGRLDEARADLEYHLKILSTHMDADCMRYQIAFVKKDSQELAHQVAVAAGKPAIENLTVWFQSLTAAYYGRRSEARDLARRAHDLATRAGLKDVAGAYLAASAIREVLFGDRAEARKLAAAAAAESDGHDVAYGNACALALAGDARRAQQLADNLNRRYPSDTLIQFVDLPIVRAGMAIERKDGAAALEAVRPATPYVLGWWSGFSLGRPIYATYFRGEAYLLAKRGPEAAVEFQKILDHPTIVVNEPIASLAHLQLARAYAQQGDKARAKVKYEDFFALWNRADPDIPILVSARKEYARLKL